MEDLYPLVTIYVMQLTKKEGFGLKTILQLSSSSWASGPTEAIPFLPRPQEMLSVEMEAQSPTFID